MTGLPIRSDLGVTLIGGGAVTADDLAAGLALAPRLVAADGGADAALALGAIPEAVIGDMDSLSDAGRQALGDARIHRIAEQNSTDFAKALRNIDAPFVIAVGFAGKRLDHTLAALNSMARHQGSPVAMLAHEDLVFRLPPSLDLPLAPGTRVSLFPLGPARGRSTGLEWPIDGIEFAPDARTGTSNRATGPVSLQIEGVMLALLPREVTATVLQALVPGGGQGA